jgi:hypothetical protein
MSLSCTHQGEYLHPGKSLSSYPYSTTAVNNLLWVMTHLIKDEVGISGSGRGKVNEGWPVASSNIPGPAQLLIMSCRRSPSGG